MISFFLIEYSLESAPRTHLAPSSNLAQNKQPIDFKYLMLIPNKVNSL